jgi:hypothetical protein
VRGRILDEADLVESGFGNLHDLFALRRSLE